MNGRRAAIAVVALLAVLALGPSAVAGDGTAVDGANESVIQSCAVESPQDFGEPANGTETIGWVDGYWYDQPVEVDTSDGLTEGELERVSARATARIEVMRCLPAIDGLPPIDVISRDEYQDQIGAGGSGDESNDGNADPDVFDNTLFETLLLSTSDSSIEDVRDEQRGETTAGFYDYVNKQITIITETPDSFLLNEPVLVHELGHAIQDQHFDVSGYERTTVDQNKAKLGLLEGDVHLVEQRYRRACEENVWNDSCLSESSSGGGGGGGGRPNIPNWGLYLMDFQPYSDGPSFIDAIYERGGWEAVNDIYDNPPESALEVAKPALYDRFEGANATVPDNSSTGWDRVIREQVMTTSETRAFETVGIAGIMAMFAEPSVENQRESPILDVLAIQNLNENGTIDRHNPYNYIHPETAGWRDDKFYVYRNGSQTANVWHLVWENATAAGPFVRSYEDLIEYRGGVPVSEYERTYEFGNESEFNGTVTVVPQDEEVTIVMGPDVDALESVYPGIFDLDHSLAPPSRENTSDETVSMKDAGATNGNESPPTAGGVLIIAIAILGGIFVVGIALLDIRRW
jgi:hypothetical protein